MEYRLTVLSPLLVGDGRKLSPIDYMIWKDQVNVLDQDRIFRLLAKGPRLDGYLQQLKRADKLDFASWGGFAQNYAGRRIPFESASLTPFWQQAQAQDLFIPTFCAGLQGPYLPGSALKGALRTGWASSRFQEGLLREIGNRMEGDKPPRRLGETAESMAVGSSANDPMKVLRAADSTPIARATFKVYLLRVAILESRGPKLDLGWKTAGRANSPGAKPDLSTPAFAEMAEPGTVFTGNCAERAGLQQAEVSRLLHWRDGHGVERLVQASNQFAAELLATQRQYAETAGLGRVLAGVEELEKQLAAAREGGRRACLVNLGWGGGFLGKAAFLKTDHEEYRRVLRLLPYYSRAIRTGLPFPKTRRIVFQNNQPAAFPGWALVEFSAS